LLETTTYDESLSPTFYWSVPTAACSSIYAPHCLGSASNVRLLSAAAGGLPKGCVRGGERRPPHSLQLSARRPRGRCAPAARPPDAAPAVRARAVRARGCGCGQRSRRSERGLRRCLRRRRPGRLPVSAARGGCAPLQRGAGCVAPGGGACLLQLSVAHAPPQPRLQARTRAAPPCTTARARWLRCSASRRPGRTCCPRAW